MEEEKSDEVVVGRRELLSKFEYRGTEPCGDDDEEDDEK